MTKMKSTADPSREALAIVNLPVGGARMLRGIATACLLLLFAVPVLAQGVEDHPGFVAFERFGDLHLEDLTIEINLGGGLLKMLSGAVEDEDGEFGELLRGLSLIKVNVFETPGSEDALAKLRSAVKELRSDGWEAVVSIRQEENLHILLRTDGDAIQGVLAAFSNDDSFGLVNIVGNFDPVQIGRLARQLDIGPLQDVDLSAVANPDNEEDDEEDGR